MPNTRFNFKTSRRIRVFISLLIFALGWSPFGYAQQPARRPPKPQQRILIEEAQKPKTARPSGPRAARPELVLQTGVTSPALNVAFSPDGRLLASMDLAAGAIKLWEVSTGRELFVITPGALAISTNAMNSPFVFSPDGSSLFSVSAGKLKQWNTRSGRQIRSVDLNQGKDFYSAHFSADARLLVTTMMVSPSLVVWDVGSGRKLHEFKFDIAIGGRLQAFGISPDGRTLAADVESDNSETLTLRDVSGGRIIRTITITGRKASAVAPSGAITLPTRAIRFTPDGRVAVAFNDASIVGSGLELRVTSRESKVRIWDVSGRELTSLDAGAQGSDMSYPGELRNFAFSNDNRQCAIASGKTIKLFDPATGRNLAAIGGQNGHNSDVVAVNFSADGKLLATASLDNTIKIWEVSAAATGNVNLARTLSVNALPVESAAFSGDGRALAVGGPNTVSVWELNTGVALRTITMPAAPARDINDLTQPPRGVFSAGGRLIAAQNGANEVKLWETRSGRELKSFRLSPGKKFAGGGVSPDGRWVALAENSPADSTSGAASPPGTSSEEMKKLQDETSERMARGGKKPNQKSPPQTGISAADLSQLEKMAENFDTAQLEKMIEQLDKAAASGDQKKMMEAISQMTGDVTSGLPGMMELSGQSLGVNLWNMNAAGGPRSLPAPPKSAIAGDVARFAFNNDGRLLASAPGSRSIKINDVASGRELFTLATERGVAVDTLAWSADGRMLASSHMELRAGANLTDVAGTYDFSIRLWDAASGRELRTMSGHGANIHALAFSPDGRILASSGFDAAVKLWDTATGREIATLNGHSLPVKSLAFSSDGKLLVSGGDDGGARVWDVRSGETLATLVTMGDGADWLVVTPDGLFDGTPGAWSRILWRFSKDNIFDVAPVEIFFNEYFYPGLLADITSGKRPKAARNVEQKDRRQPSLKLSRAGAHSAAIRMIKVKVEVSEPASSGQATPVGARDVRLFRNGTLVKFWRGDALKGQKQATLEADVPIVAGENRLVAYAFNHDNVKSPDAVLSVIGDESLRREGVAYVIACGVNQYANTQYNLKYAVADATSFAEEIRAQQAKLQEYERVEVIPLLDREATKANILLALKRLSNSQAALPTGAPPVLSKIQPAQPEDAVLIFFAGHGAAQGARFYLIPHDLGYAGSRNALDARAVRTILSHGVSDLELEAALEGVDAGRMLFVLDACNSGQALEAEEKRRGPMNSTGLAQLAYEKGMYILTAAQSYQAALEAAELGHGYLTFALIEDGLKKGSADRDPKDGLALAREWFNYAEERVPQMQEREMQTRLLLDFAVDEAKAKDPKQRSTQRPRVFYRRELEALPFVVAKP
jgi:WD40 repeat protein/uncharacterized caspase-like protein